MTEAFVGLGSNIGDRLGNLRRAIEAIAAIEDTHVLAVSNVVESEPWGVTEQPPFANAVARLETLIPADRFLGLLKDVEVALGRKTGMRYGPRPIDLDILLFGDDEWETAELTIPHPRLAERDFAVTPLLEVGPDAAWPDGSAITRERATEGRIIGVLGPVPGFEEFTPTLRTAGVQPHDDAGPWEEVAAARFNSHGGITVSGQLMFEAAVLEQEGIPVTWDPLPPEEEYSPWMLQRNHRLLVPEAFAERARAILAEVRAARPLPEGYEAESGLSDGPIDDPSDDI